MGQLESFNPATGELVGSVETLKPDQVQAVVDDVAEVQPFWAQLSLADRARYLRKAADVLVEEVDEIAELLTREQGKPITESYTMEADPRDVREGRASGGPRARSPWRWRGRERPVRVVRAEDLLHRVGRGRPQGRRDLRPPAQGLRARARGKGPADRLRRRGPGQRDL